MTWGDLRTGHQSQKQAPASSCKTELSGRSWTGLQSPRENRRCFGKTEQCGHCRRGRGLAGIATGTGCSSLCSELASRELAWLPSCRVSATGVQGTGTEDPGGPHCKPPVFSQPLTWPFLGATLGPTCGEVGGHTAEEGTQVGPESGPQCVN